MACPKKMSATQGSSERRHPAGRFCVLGWRLLLLLRKKQRQPLPPGRRRSANQRGRRSAEEWAAKSGQPGVAGPPQLRQSQKRRRDAGATKIKIGGNRASRRRRGASLGLRGGDRNA